MHFISLFAWTLATVAASPVPEAEGGLEARATPVCGANNKAYKILKDSGARGSIYCNDVLKLTTSTTYTVARKATVTSYEIVPSVTGTCLLEHGDGDDSEYVDDGGDSSAPTPEGKRDEESLEKRQNLAGIAAGSITAGCRCLSLRPRTVTATITPEPKVVRTKITAGTTCTPYGIPL